MTVGDNVVFKGGAVSISSEADNSVLFDDDSTAVGIIEKIIDELDSISVLAGVSIAEAIADITLGDGVVIDGSTIDLYAHAVSSSEVRLYSTGIGFVWAQTKAVATITVGTEAGTSESFISGTDSITMTSYAEGTLSASATTYNFGKGVGSPVDVTVTIGKATITSNVDIYDAVVIRTGGDLTVEAKADKSISVSATAGVYEDGMVGVTLALSFLESDVEAQLGGLACGGGRHQRVGQPGNPQE